MVKSQVKGSKIDQIRIKQPTATVGIHKIPANSYCRNPLGLNSWIPTVTVGQNLWIATVAVGLNWLFGSYLVFGTLNLIFDQLRGFLVKATY